MTATKIALSYLAISILWICFSDQIILLLFHNTRVFTHIQTYKGWVFVTASALVLFLLLEREIKRYERTEEALRTNEHYLVSIFRAAPTGIGVVSNRVMLTVNDRICAMSGYSREELIGQSARMLYPDAAEYDRVGLEKYDQLREHHTGTVEARWQRKDGQCIDVLLSSTPLDPQNFAAGLTFMALDITERKQAERALRESEDRYHTLIDLAIDGILLGSREGLITEANKYMCMMVGRAREYLIGEHISSLPCLESLQKDPLHLDLLQKGEIVQREQTLIRPDGSAISFEIRSKMMPDGTYQSVYRDITERQKTEKALRESEEKFALAFDASPDAININRLEDGLYVESNRGFTELTGFTREDVRGKTSWEIDLWHDHADRRRLIESLRQQGYYENLEAKFRRKDGSLTTVLMSARTISLNNVPHILSISRDIEKLKQAEQENMAQKRLFETMFNAITDTIIITDIHRQIQLANGAMAAMFGYQPKDLYGKTTETLYLDHNAYPEAGASELSLQATRGTDLSIVTYRDSSGRVFPGETFRTGLYDSNNQWIGNLVIIRDITQRQKNEADLERLRVAVEHSAEIFVITDTLGTIQYANPAFERVTGYTIAEVLGQNPRILKSGEHDQAFYTQLWDTISSGRTWTGHLVNKKKDGTLYTEEATLSPVFDTQGKIVNYVGIKRDITAHLKLEAQYLQAQKMESVGRLTGGVAHDFNNILTVILGYTELALRQTNTESSQKLHFCLEKIYDAGNRSADIVRQLLAFSRKQTIEPKVLDLNDTVAGMLKMLHLMIGENIDFAWMPTSDLSTIKMDPAQIDQILANLCVNARDAINGIGQVTLATQMVHIDADYCAKHPGCLPGGYVMLSVSDNGCGMDKAVLAQIFEPFFTTKAVDCGTGLGLATVYGIVKQNDGFIEVDSEPGAGTTFRVYLPLYQNGTESQEQENIEHLEMGQGETVLLVEDDPVILEMGLGMLEWLGYQVLSSTSPSQALQLDEEYAGTIDLLITDLIMPGMNGKELGLQLLARHPTLKLLYMSGYTADVIAHHGVLDKGVHFLHKPFSTQTLSTKVREVLDE